MWKFFCHIKEKAQTDGDWQEEIEEYLDLR